MLVLVAGISHLSQAQTIKKLTLSPASVGGGNMSTGTVTLSSKAGTKGLVVSISSSNTAASAPSSVTVPSGATSTSFSVTTTPVVATTTAVIKGVVGSSSATATLTIQAAKLTSLTFSPSSLTGGATSTGTVSLGSAAPSGGIKVALTSSSLAWGGPSSVSIAAGSTSTTFTITTLSVAASTVAKIMAKITGSSAAATLTIKPAVLNGLTLNPTSLGGGATSTGTVALSGPAPAGGLKVNLTSSQAVASVPKSITVQAGSTGGTFAITTVRVTQPISATIKATQGTSAVTAKLAINPLVVSSVTLNPTTLVGGTKSTGTVTLNGPAPIGGLSLALSSNQASATVPANLTISGGASTATFAVTTQVVASQTSATITASLLVSSASATLTINPPTLTGFTLSPTSLVGGTNSTGTISMSQAAPSGGLSVSLTGGQAENVPATVTIPQGATSTTFTISTSAVATKTVANNTATFGASSIKASLTILPPTIFSLVLSPASVVGGTNSTGTVTLSSPAPAAGFAIGLSSNQASAIAPSTVSVSGGTTSATFTVTTTAVGTQTSATITATDPSGNKTTAQLTLTPQQLLVVQLPVNDITFDPISGNIWAAVPSTGGAYANSIVAVDPKTGAIGTSINVGAEPSHVRVTDNGQYAFVDVKADGSVRRANLKTGAMDGIYAIKKGGVFDLETVPGSTSSYVLVTDPTYGVNTTVWDGETARQNTGAGGYDIRFAGSNSLIYGDGHGSLFVDTLNSTEINWTQQYSLDVSGFEYANNLLYTAVPTVVDPIQQIVVESIPVTDFLLQNVEVAVSPSENRIYYVSWDSSHNKRILDFNMTTYEEYPYFDGTANIPGGCNDLLACGNHTVAFYVFGDNVTQNIVIIHGLK